ncbi:Aste57867_23501 [Aphanomyces stellatus]|uniref:Aste57867_23501 protein n=1 Tax=Aphanomyces stellatus TaxID=120398 RepID=A0A485LPI7_9STRA|nr:hypothetical protein As57867_023430 [Aphanomyces stellatus]VFU00146.1 Aste57867_23501 [Aphanomyces stellatus]
MYMWIQTTFDLGQLALGHSSAIISIKISLPSPPFYLIRTQYRIKYRGGAEWLIRYPAQLQQTPWIPIFDVEDSSSHCEIFNPQETASSLTMPANNEPLDETTPFVIASPIVHYSPTAAFLVKESNVQRPCAVVPSIYSSATTSRDHIGLDVRVAPPRVVPRRLAPAWLVAFFTLFMTAAGSSFMGIPFMFVLAPWPIVLGCMAFVAAAMAFASDLLTIVYLRTRQNSFVFFHGLSRVAFGPLWAHALHVLMVFALCGSCVASAKLVVDLSPAVLELCHVTASVATARMTVLTVFVVLVCPLNLVKNISSLALANYLGALATVCLVLAVVYRAVERSSMNASSLPPDSLAMPTLYVAVPQILSTFNYAFSSVWNILPSFRAIHDDVSSHATLSGAAFVDAQAHSVMTRVLCAKVMALATMYATFGLLAIQLYGATHIQGDVLLNLSNDALMTLPRMAVLVAAIFAFPVLFQPMFLMAEAIALQTCKSSAPHLPAVPRTLLSFVFLVAIVIVSVVVPGIQSVFAVCGGVFVTINSYLFPIALYLSLVREPHWTLRRVLCYVVGIVIATSGIVATLHVIQGHA